LIWVAVVLLLFAHHKGKKKFELPNWLFGVATLILLLTFFLGAILGVNPTNSFHTVHKYLTFLLIFPLAAMALGSKEIEKLLSVFLYGAAVCAVFGIGKHFILHQDRIDSFSGDKTVFGGLLMVSFLILAYFLKNNSKAILWWALVPLLGPALLLTQNHGAWLGLIAGFILWAWRFNKKWLLVGIVILGTLPFLLPSALQQRIESIGDIWIHFGADHQIQNANNERIFIWTSGFKIIKDYPWGIGQGNMEDVFPKYRNPNSTEWIIPHLHNNFLQILAQNGWIGLAAYLFWIAVYYGTALRFRSDDLKAQTLNWTFLCVFTAILVWGMTEYTFSHQFMNVQFFLLGLQLGLWRTGGIPAKV
jgi:O-antigen ligase